MSTYFPIQLPSRCLPYAEVKPEDITIRPYCGEDEIFLAQISHVNLERNFLSVLKRILQGLDPKQLTLGDRQYIVIWEYINSYSEYVRVNAMCGKCLELAEFNVDLRTLNVMKLPEDFKQPQEVQLPISKEKAQLKLLTVGDKVESERLLEKGADTYLYECACSVVCADPLAQAEIMKSWHAKDIARVRLFQEQNKHGPLMLKSIKCPLCEEEVQIPVPFRRDYFFPTGETLRDCFRA